MIDTPRPIATSPTGEVLPGSATFLEQQLAVIDQTPRPALWGFGAERQFWRDTAIAQEKSRYLGEYLVALVARVEALETELAALKK
ncbi:MAG: hypothetical protein ABJA94_01210 [Rhodoglobus sp.]